MEKKILLICVFIIILCSCKLTDAANDTTFSQTQREQMESSESSDGETFTQTNDDQFSEKGDASTSSKKLVDDRLIGNWEYLYDSDGYDAFFYDIEFLKDGTFLIPNSPYLMTNEFDFSNPENGRLILISDNYIEEINYELFENELRLFFYDGYNVYQKEGSKTEISDVFIGEPIRKYINLSGRLSPIDEKNFLITSRKEISLLNGQSFSTSQIYSFNLNNLDIMGITPDGKKVVTGFNNVIMYDIEKSEQVFSVEGRPREVVFSPDGKTFASTEGDRKSVTIRDFYTGSVFRIIKGDASYNILSVPIAYSPDGKFLVIVGEANTVNLWDINKGSIVYFFQSDEEDRVHFTSRGYSNSSMHSVMFSPDGEFLAVSSSNGKLYILDIVSKKLLHTLEGEGAVRFSPNGKFVAVPCSSMQSVCFYNVKSGELIQRLLTDEIYKVTDIAFSNDGQLLIAKASTSYIGPSVKSDNLITIWQIKQEYASGIVPQVTAVPPTDFNDEDSNNVLVTPTPNTQCPGAPPQRLKVGEMGVVCTKSDSLRLRSQPGLNGSVISSVKPGTTFEVIGGPECAGNNWSWWQIRLNDGETGWLAEGGDSVDPYFLCPVD